MLFFSLCGLLLLTSLADRQLDVFCCNGSKYFAVHRLLPAEHFQCLELSKVQTSTAAVLLRQLFYENSYTEAVCFKVSYRSLCPLMIFKKLNTFQNILNEEILMYKILLSSSLTRNTKEGQTFFPKWKVKSCLFQHWTQEEKRGFRAGKKLDFFISGASLMFGKYLLGIYLKTFRSNFIHNGLTLWLMTMIHENWGSWISSFLLWR